MNVVFFLFFTFSFIFLISFNSYAELKCSSNGAELIYINGVLTSKKKGEVGWESVKKNLNYSDVRPNQLNESLDLLSVRSKFLHNPTYGLLNDTAEMFSQMFYAKYGTKAGYQYFMILNDAPDIMMKTIGKAMPHPVLKGMGLLGISKPANFLTMQVFAEESMKNAFLNVFMSKPNLLEANEGVINEVASHLSTLKLQKKKAIIIAHSQGNAVLSAAVKKFAFSNIENRQYLTNYFGFYQVGTPVPPLNQLLGFMPNQEQKDFNSEYVLSSDDWIIKNANVLSGILSRLLEIPLYQSQPNYTPHEESEITDPTLHGFREIYTNPNYKFVQPNSNGKPIPASELSKEYLRTIASKLQSNCNQPKAVITYDGEPSEYETSFTKKYKFYANESLLYSDKPDSKGEFKNYRWRVEKNLVTSYEGAYHSIPYGVPVVSNDRGEETFEGKDMTEIEFAVEHYGDFKVVLEVEREDGVKDETSYSFKPQKMIPYYKSHWLSQCYKYNKVGNYAFTASVEIGNHNYKEHRYKINFVSGSGENDVFGGIGVGSSVFSDYNAFLDIWGIYGDDVGVKVTYFDSTNYVIAEQNLITFDVPTCNESSAFEGVRPR